MVIAGTIVALPLLLVVILRTNAAILFFVLTGASTLHNYLDKDVAGFLGAILPGKNVSWGVSMALFGIPLVVAALAFRNTVHGMMLFIQGVLSMLVGAALLFISPQFMPLSLLLPIQSSSFYQSAQAYSSLVIGLAFFASVVLIWLGHPKQLSGKKHTR